jgi:integrase/recombinase XerD
MTPHGQPNTLARALRRFFAEHLPLVRALSPHTIRSYRDAFALLLRFLAKRRGRDVVDLDLVDLDPDSILAFLEELETGRGNCVATRNARLAAIHSFARFVAAQHPEHLEACQRLLAVPTKRATLRVVEYLEADEIGAMLDSTDCRTAQGRRDYALIVVMFNTGARVQEVLDLRPCDLQLVRPLQARFHGKGRKERICPLWPRTAKVLRAFLAEMGLDTVSAEPIFRNRRGEPLTRFGVRYLLRRSVARAQSAAPGLVRKRVHPHTIRHSTAVHLLQSGVDLVTISHWLGHASVETTNRYAVVDLETKRAALDKAGPVGNDNPVLTPWRSDASILDWLEAL